jgi:hypothetical protein
VRVLAGSRGHHQSVRPTSGAADRQLPPCARLDRPHARHRSTQPLTGARNRAPFAAIERAVSVASPCSDRPFTRERCLRSRAGSWWRAWTRMSACRARSTSTWRGARATASRRAWCACGSSSPHGWPPRGVFAFALSPDKARGSEPELRGLLPALPCRPTAHARPPPRRPSPPTRWA